MTAPPGRAIKRTQAELRAILAQWDKGDLAPLTESQQDSWMTLATQTQERPFPQGLVTGSTRSPATPVTPVSTPSKTASGSPHDHVSVGDIGVDEKIETSQQFFKWFGNIEAQMEEAHESSFRAYHELLSKYSDRCTQVLDEVANAKKYLGTIESQHKSASGKTRALHDACEQLVREQSDLVAFNESIQTRLSFFVELETLTQKLNAPTLSVLNEHFVPMLGRLDECMRYVEDHPDYKEAALYTARFKQCQNKAMSLVKIHVVNTLRAATQHVSAQVQKSGGDANDASFTLFYGKFRMHAPRIKMLMNEIQKRSKSNADFAALLQDCYDCYYTQRRGLLQVPVTKHMQEITVEHSADLPALVRSGCSYMARVCCNEYQLYQHFFQDVDVGMHDFLESLADILYDICRPMFIRNVHSIDVLVELCSVLRVEAMDNKGEEVMAFAAVAEQMLQDVQQRLCYVVQNYMRTHIQGFTPQPRDIDYPARLTHAPSTRETDDPTATTASGGADAGKTLLNGTGDGGVQHASGGAAVTGAGSVRTEGSGADVGTAAPPAATAASVEVTENGDGVDTTWYPSVSRTIVLLSKLYRSVDKDVFQILSEELVHACLDTLDSAATMVGAKSGKVHAQLFMIKHLLVVREQLSPFDVEMTKTEKILDFGGFLATLRHAATDLLTSPKTSVFADTTGSILSFLQRTTPQILETKEDARQLLEDKLRNACMAFITDTCRKSTTSINSFLVMADVTKGKPLSEQPFATPEKIRDLVREASSALRTHIADASSVMRAYVDEQTVGALTQQMTTHTLAVYDRFHDIVAVAFTADDDVNIIGLPSKEQVRLTMKS